MPGPGYGDLGSSVEGHLFVRPNSGVVMFRAGVVGKNNVTATVSISSKLEKTGQFQLDQDQTLTVSTIITIVEGVALTNTSPGLYSGGLLLLPQSNYQKSANKGLTTRPYDRKIFHKLYSGCEKIESVRGRCFGNL